VQRLRIFKRIIFALAVAGGPSAYADGNCNHMEVWDYPMSMCMPLAMAGMPMKMIMVHGNSFFTQTFEEGPRGQNAFSIPDMLMVDAGSSVGDRQYLAVDFMGTVEKWTLPKNGYPELLQIGEEREDGSPFLDDQHPHSSPVMGLTFSDTVSLPGFLSGDSEDGRKNHAKIWFAPRGESTDGPIAFMHRPTGMVNPDAPLGHHIGQDVGHISSTVLGVSMRLARTTVEVSAFHGAEPNPEAVDLPMGTIDSYAARVTEQFARHFFAMASAAYVKSPEPSEPQLDHIWRYSASAYGDASISEGWTLHETLIWGLINNYDQASSLNSFANEFWLNKDAYNFWGRLEVLQRTPRELAITSTDDINRGRWVTAATLGYTQRLAQWEAAELGLGVSVTKDFLPAEFESTYGGDPLTAKIFLQMSGMKMWEM
jgi:hypothetical protein